MEAEVRAGIVALGRQGGGGEGDEGKARTTNGVGRDEMREGDISTRNGIGPPWSHGERIRESMRRTLALLENRERKTRDAKIEM